MTDKSNADVLSWALDLSMSNKKIVKTNEKNDNDEENRSPNLKGRSNADILDYALTLSSKKKQKVNRNYNDMTTTYEHNNDMNTYDNDVNNDEHNNDDIDMNTNNDNLELDNNEDTHNQSPIKVDKAAIHHLLLDKAAKVLEFELIDILNNGTLEQLLELKGIGKKIGQNILDLREDSFKFNSLSQIEEIGIPKSKIGDFINKNLGIVLTRQTK